jgi:hypothetical protein
MQRPPESKRPPVDPASIPETEEKPPDPLEEQAAAGWLPGEVGLLATPFERHPAAERHLALARQDVLQTGLLRRVDMGRFERFAQLDALVYPRASFEALQACGGFNHWLFFVDDHYDTDASFAASPERVDDLMQRAFDTLATGHLPRQPAPLDRFSVAVGQRIRALASAGHFYRFLDNTFDYLYRGSRVALTHWNETLPPERLRPLRRLDSSMNAVVDITELACGGELTERELTDPVVQELRQLCGDHVAFLNDLVSYHREVVRAGSAFNLLNAIAVHECDGSVAAAIPRLVTELNRVARRFEALAKTTTGLAAQHAIGLRLVMAGNHRFSFESGRYHHPHAHLAELREPHPLDPPTKG